MRALLVLAFAFLFPSAVFAHTSIGDTSGLVHGFQHPLAGLDHVLAMVAVGVFAFAVGGRALWLLPMSFVGMMIAGFLLGVTGVSLPFVELGIALSSVVIGLAAARGRSMPTVAAMALVGVFAVFHGHAHGVEMPQDGGGLLYASGFIAATLLLHLLGIAVALGASRLAGKYASRVAPAAGVAISLGGMGVLLGWL